MQIERKTKHKTKWPTVVALAVLLAATAVDWTWVWGVFFLYWSVNGIATGQAFVVQMVRRDENPGLFWFISISWVVLAALMIFYDFFP